MTSKLEPYRPTAIEAGHLVYEVFDAIVDGQHLIFDVGNGGDAILDVELVVFDIATARFGNAQKAHLLINPAADFNRIGADQKTTRDGFETIWGTHHLGSVLLVGRLMDLLIASPQGRIINQYFVGRIVDAPLTVDLKDQMFGKRPYSAQKTYYQTKLAQLMDENLNRISGRQFTHLLKEIGIPAYAKDTLCIEQVMQLTYRQLGIQPAISFDS